MDCWTIVNIIVIVASLIAIWIATILANKKMRENCSCR